MLFNKRAHSKMMLSHFIFQQIRALCLVTTFKVSMKQHILINKGLYFALPKGNGKSVPYFFILNIFQS